MSRRNKRNQTGYQSPSTEQPPAWARELFDRIDGIEDRLARLEKRVDDTLYNQQTPTAPNYQTDISMPTFSGNNQEEYPKTYLERLDQYFQKKRVREEDKITLVENSLKGSASIWFNTINYLCDNYNAFTVMFLEEYWPSELQLKIWSQFSTTGRVPNIQSYRNYFGTWAQRIRQLDTPRVTEAQMITTIARHYPGYIQAMLMGMSEKTYSAAYQVLNKEDTYKIEVQKDVPRPDSNNTFYRNQTV